MQDIYKWFVLLLPYHKQKQVNCNKEVNTIRKVKHLENNHDRLLSCILYVPIQRTFGNS